MDLHALISDSFARLADSLEQQAPEVWDKPSLCAGWRVRDLVAHVTMAARLTDQQFGAELAAVGGDFQLLSDTIAVRDGELPVAEHLTNLRSPELAEWEPPGGGAIGALNHAVVRSRCHQRGRPPARLHRRGRARHPRQPHHRWCRRPIRCRPV